MIAPVNSKKPRSHFVIFWLSNCDSGRKKRFFRGWIIADSHAQASSFRSPVGRNSAGLLRHLSAGLGNVMIATAVSCLSPPKFECAKNLGELIDCTTSSDKGSMSPLGV